MQVILAVEAQGIIAGSVCQTRHVDAVTTVEDHAGDASRLVSNHPIK